MKRSLPLIWAHQLVSLWPLCHRFLKNSWFQVVYSLECQKNWKTKEECSFHICRIKRKSNFSLCFLKEVVKFIFWPYLQRKSSQQSVLIFISIVRLALVTSVMWQPPLVPPVRFYEGKQQQASSIVIQQLFKIINSDWLIFILAYLMKSISKLTDLIYTLQSQVRLQHIFCYSCEIIFY